jgi:hypothetical protein
MRAAYLVAGTLAASLAQVRCSLIDRQFDEPSTAADSKEGHAGIIQLQVAQPPAR